MGINLSKLAFGTMKIQNNNKSIHVLKYALKNFKIFHLSSEYKSFNVVSKFIKKKKNPN